MGMSRSEAGKLGAEASKKYRNECRRKNIENYNLNPKKCLNCEKSIPYDKRVNNYCCRFCAVVNNIKYLKSKPRKKHYCIQCDKLCVNGIKFCSNKCQHTYHRLQKIINGTAGSACVKTYLLKTFGHKCSECGIENWNNKPIVMELEHIDGNHLNNSLENVCLLCPNCHSQTSTYKAKNTGNGRHYRRERYKNNKSY